MKTDIMRIRIPTEAKAWLKSCATADDRSMNYVIVKLIEAERARSTKQKETKP